MKTLPLKKRISPTRYGWLFIIILIGMLSGSINYNNNLGFLFTFLLASMALVSLIHTYKNVSDIRVESAHARPVFEKQQAVFELRLFPVSSTRTAVRFGFDGYMGITTDITPGIAKHVSVAFPALKRGRLSPKKMIISSSYPYGLFQIKIDYVFRAECLVYPNPTPFRNLTVHDLLQAHSTEGAAHASIDDFKGLRSYQHGDPIQHIFWKAFARGQGLMIKEFMGNDAPSLYFNWRKIKAENSEKKLSILCAMILKAHGMKLSYGLNIPGRMIAPDTGERHKHACLRSLALYGNA